MACLNLRHLFAHALQALLHLRLNVRELGGDNALGFLHTFDSPVITRNLLKNLFDGFADRRHAALPVVLAAL